jgi:hypothetical protein
MMSRRIIGLWTRQHTLNKAQPLQNSGSSIIVVGYAIWEPPCCTKGTGLQMESTRLRTHAGPCFRNSIHTTELPPTSMSMIPMFDESYHT